MLDITLLTFLVGWFRTFSGLVLSVSSLWLLLLVYVCLGHNQAERSIWGFPVKIHYIYLGCEIPSLIESEKDHPVQVSSDFGDCLCYIVHWHSLMQTNKAVPVLYVLHLGDVRCLIYHLDFNSISIPFIEILALSLQIQSPHLRRALTLHVSVFSSYVAIARRNTIQLSLYEFKYGAKPGRRGRWQKARVGKEEPSSR